MRAGLPKPKANICYFFLEWLSSENAYVRTLYENQIQPSKLSERLKRKSKLTEKTGRLQFLLEQLHHSPLSQGNKPPQLKMDLQHRKISPGKPWVPSARASPRADLAWAIALGLLMST
ncbi:unnamed protein product [Prunus armeniaca]